MCDFSEITDHIFIGNVHTVTNKYTTEDTHILDILKIDVVISALTDYEYNNYGIDQSEFPDKEWHKLIIEDDEEEKISEHFERTHEIIQAAIAQNKKVLVHCAAGISRSPTLVIAHLMLENKWNLEEAYQFVKKKRYVTRPNIGFMNQLKLLEIYT